MNVTCCAEDSADALIAVCEFCKTYDGRPAVSDCTFDVKPGQILGIIGPNGAGKTTTMRSIAALIPPTRGTLRVAGFDVVAQAIDVKRRIAYVPDDPQLFSHLTVEEHLAFTAAAYGVEDADARAASLLEDFDLAARRRTPAKDLSRGMRQKLAICCGYLYDPLAILFDEPLTGLDPHGIRTLKESMLQRAENGAAILVSSHLLAMVEDICSHILLLHEGRQRFFGPLDRFRQQFTTEDAATTLEHIFFMATTSPQQEVGRPAAVSA
jgi:ABC-2 type transport system ATP-binding protein